MRRLALALLCLPALLGLTQAVAGPPRAAERWALLVGVDRHSGSTRDNIGAVGDVRAFREALVRVGFRDDHIKILVNEEATADGIRRGLEWLAARSSETSYSVFHYSGHVKQMKSADGDSESLDEHLWGADNRFVADGEVAARLRSVRGWVWADFAGCEAAGLWDGLPSTRHLVTGSSREDEKSYEDPSAGRSVYVDLLVQQGILARHADANRDHRVSIHEAFGYAARAAPQITARQRKGDQHPVMAGGDGSTWFLMAPPAPKPPAPPPPKPVKRTRTVTLTYTGPSVATDQTGCLQGCYVVRLRSDERYVRLDVRDATGTRIGVAGPFGTVCGSRLVKLGRRSSMELHLVSGGSCTGVPSSGTIRAVLSNLP